MTTFLREELPKLNIGIVGLGNAGSSLLPAIHKHPYVSVTAACGRSKDRLEKFARDYNADIFYSMEEMCLSDVIDAVYIASPTELHASHVKTAVENRKHVIVEKPMAISLVESAELVEAAKRFGVQLIVGHSHSFEPPIQKIREVVKSGELGELKMINNWYFNDWIYRPRTPDELDTNLGGGVTYRQGSHQFDIIRYIGGGLLRSVRAMAGVWDQKRPTEGAHAVFLEFENGAAATAVYNGYDHFHSTELTFGIGEGGPSVQKSQYGHSRLLINSLADTNSEIEIKKQKGNGGTKAKDYTKENHHQPFFGLTIVSCQKGDIRQSPNGLYVYGEKEKYEIVLGDETGRDAMIGELYNAVVKGERAIHNGEWGMANLEVCMAVLESARERKEIFLSHQVSNDF